MQWMEEQVVPRPRGSVPVLCALVFGGVTMLGFWLHDPALLKQFIFLMMSPILGEILHSFCRFIEEWLHHSHQRYRGNTWHIFQACFSTYTLVAAFVLFLVLLLGCDVPEHLHFFVLTSIFYLLLKALGVLGPSPVEISEVCENRNMNVAHGLAWSFYLGYLQIVLPELEKCIGAHYNKTRERLSSSRLHILLPLNAVVMPKLEDEDGTMRFHQNLPEIWADRGGIRGRVYKHSIYKITDDDNKTHFCVVEFATPLETLYKMSHNRTAGFSERDRRQQVLLFYRTLTNILESSLECRNHYCLILLDDEKAGEPHYLSKEIIKHLKQQKNEISMQSSQEQQTPVVKMAEFRTQNNGFNEEPLSSIPSLMISEPMSLHSQPEENTDYTNNHYQNRHM